MSVGDTSQQLLCTLANNVCTSCEGNALLLHIWFRFQGWTLDSAVEICKTNLKRLYYCIMRQKAQPKGLTRHQILMPNIVRKLSTIKVRLKSCFVAALLKRLKMAFVLKIGSYAFRWTAPRIPSDQEIVPTWMKTELSLQTLLLSV